MQSQTAENILLNLIQGKDPKTGLSIEPGNPILEEEVKQALSSALETIKSIQVSRMKLPANTGKAWTQDDDIKLAQEYDQGVKIEQIAKNFRRTNGSIRARLIKLGKIENILER